MCRDRAHHLRKDSEPQDFTNDSYLTFDPNILIRDPTPPTTEQTNGVNKYMAILAIINFLQQTTYGSCEASIGFRNAR